LPNYQPKAIPAVSIIIHFSEQTIILIVVTMPRPSCWLHGSGVIDHIQTISHAR